MLIKPASSLCNLRCRYCFYHEEARNREVASHGIMTPETAKQLIDRAYADATGHVSFAFQGGEPTLAGLDFFEFFTDYAKRANERRLAVSYSIQTNGMLLASDAKWADFFRRHAFLVGLSVDGTRDQHDLNRITPDGGGSYSNVLKAAAALDRAHVDYNILTVVNSSTVRHGVSIYNSYRKNGWRYMQFIPCIGEDAPDDAAYGDFLCTLFDLWYADMERGEVVSIRLFDNLLGLFAGYPPETCGMLGVCTVQYVVESDGSVYPCDFYAVDDRLLGNLHDSSLRTLFESETAQDFIRSSAVHDEGCRDCKWYAFCRGGCRRYKDENNRYLYCRGFYRFLDYSGERFSLLARRWMRQMRRSGR